ncbi:putative MFS sugar transporter [Aspergillus novofumigatus IBT 16806]|uniref:Major facilitator superfamily (MFS) profile domain-containing protein n=1 Tax=Aspergillus novofumigatus (strain IBT 16806) TaxID=1392255 RepID=A0A2I1CGW6_ASPN1|nr:uncharacterized protein P174DRAFT_417870 [Aspergillus novofumigatus IBT 16806]PKX96871.1 hypothetical protein P174DRAFT_417870 [Aspergillus novofumigatus IBT 16806]
MPTVLSSNVDLSKNLSLIIGGCVQVMFVIGSFFPTFFVDRVGRRRPDGVGSFGLGLCMMLVSVLMSFKGTANEHATSSASVAFFLPLHAHLRRTCQLHPLGLFAGDPASSCQREKEPPWNSFVVMITPIIIINRLQWKAYLIFMCTNFAFLPVIYFCYPETANLALEEIGYLFTNSEKTAVKICKELHKERKNPLAYKTGPYQCQGGAIAQ